MMRVLRNIIRAALLCVLLLPAFAFADAPDDHLEKDFSDSAGILRELGLFRGAANGYELDRAPTRAEAAVMLVRLLGKEDVALASRNTHPFKDVPSWASPYIAYMYANNLTNGVSRTEFGTGDCDAKMYASFALRALGYDDANGDFPYEDALSFAYEIDMISKESLYRLADYVFLRGDLAVMSLWTIFTELKGNELCLIDRLVSEKAVDLDAAKKYNDILTAEIITSRGFFLSEEENGYESRLVETYSLSEAGYAPITTRYISNSKGELTEAGWIEIDEITELAPDREESFVIYSANDKYYYDLGDGEKFVRDATESEEEEPPMTLSGLFLQYKSATIDEKDGKTVIREEMSDETAVKRAKRIVSELLYIDEDLLDEMSDDEYTIKLRNCTDTYTFNKDGYVLEWTESLDFYFQFRVSLRDDPPYLIVSDRAAEYINPGAPVNVVLPDLSGYRDM
jgi:hypothetical protein